MNTYTKRAIALLLCLCMLPLTAPVSARADDLYMEEVIERYEEFHKEDNGNPYDQLITGSYYNYARWSDNINAKGVPSKQVMWATNQLLDKQWNTKAYTDYLKTIMTQMDLGFERSVASQAVYDLQTDYAAFAKDLADTLGENILLQDFLAPEIKEQLKKTLSVLMDAKDVTELMNTAIEDTNQLYFCAVAQASYRKKVIFLEMLRDNSKDPHLVEAANDTLQVMNLEFAFFLKNYTLEFAQDMLSLGLDTSDLVQSLGNLVPKLTQKLSDKFPQWVKAITKSSTNAASKLLKAANTVTPFFSTLALGAQAMDLTGEVLEHTQIGTQAEYFREMHVMDAIADALYPAMLKANNAAASGSTGKRYDAICQYVIAGEALAYTHLRGEHCMMRVFEMQGGDTAQLKYDYAMTKEKVQKSYNMLSQILTPAFTEEHVTSDGFTFHNEFILPVNMLSEVPEGYVGIYNFADLMALRGAQSGKYILMDDIRCDDSYDDSYMKGIDGLTNIILDGNGFSIVNISTPLFGNVKNCTITNLKLKASCKLTLDPEAMEKHNYPYWNGCYYGMLCCYLENSLLDNCVTTGEVFLAQKTHTLPKYQSVSLNCGGFAGEAFNITLQNCCNAASISYEGTKGYTYVGGLIGYSSLSSNTKFGSDTFQNCCNIGSISVNEPNGGVYAGGLIGGGFYATLNHCYNAGAVSAIGESYVYTGGLAGKYSNAACSWCWNSGAVTASLSILPEDLSAKDGMVTTSDRWSTPVSAAAGMVSLTDGGTSMVGNERNDWYCCRNTGTIAADFYSGGLAALVEEHIYIADCYNLGSVSSKYYAGGLLASASANLDPYVRFHNCYSTGTLTGQFRGGIAGFMMSPDKNKCFDCFSPKTIPAVANSSYDGVQYLTSDQLLQKETYTAFFDRTWSLQPNSQNNSIYIWHFNEGDSFEPLKLRF